MSSKKVLMQALVVVAGLLLVASSNAWAVLCQANADCNTKVDLSDLVVMKQDFNKTGCDPCMCNPNSECPTGMMECDNSCVDPMTDEANCGDCNIPCSGTCVEGACQPGSEVCNGDLSPLGRWCDQLNGTVKDMTTGLAWLKNAGWGSQFPFWINQVYGVNAQDRAAQLWDGSPWEETANLSDGSVEGDWRLPTKSELAGIVGGEEYIRRNQLYFFTNMPSYGFTLSSTTSPNDPNSAWAADMGNGDIVYVAKYLYYNVWPVRKAARVEQQGPTTTTTTSICYDYGQECNLSSQCCSGCCCRCEDPLIESGWCLETEEECWLYSPGPWCINTYCMLE